MTGAPKLLGDLASLTSESGVAVDGGAGFVIMRAERTDGSVLVGQVDGRTARAIALVLLEAAEAADHDSAMFRATVAAGMDPTKAAQLLDLVRRWRAAELEADERLARGEDL